MNQADWCKLMESVGFTENETTYEELVKAYNEKHRGYHNSSHINAVLTEFSEVTDLADDAAAIELALWFHDAIYKIRSTINEKESADWAAKFIRENSGTVEFSKVVHSLIMATEHNFLPMKNDEKIIVDVDLSILGSPEEKYWEFEDNIRKEYKIIPWFIYRKKRIALLEYFLNRDHIYSHDYFREKYQVQARENLTKAIDKLQLS